MSRYQIKSKFKFPDRLFDQIQNLKWNPGYQTGHKGNGPKQLIILSAGKNGRIINKDSRMIDFSAER